jgi:hypothetical protein
MTDYGFAEEDTSDLSDSSRSTFGDAQNSGVYINIGILQFVDIPIGWNGCLGKTSLSGVIPSMFTIEPDILIAQGAHAPWTQCRIFDAIHEKYQCKKSRENAFSSSFVSFIPIALYITASFLVCMFHSSIPVIDALFDITISEAVHSLPHILVAFGWFVVLFMLCPPVFSKMLRGMHVANSLYCPCIQKSQSRRKTKHTKGGLIPGCEENSFSSSSSSLSSVLDDETIEMNLVTSRIISDPVVCQSPYIGSEIKLRLNPSFCAFGFMQGTNRISMDYTDSKLDVELTNKKDDVVVLTEKSGVCGLEKIRQCVASWYVHHFLSSRRLSGFVCSRVKHTQMSRDLLVVSLTLVSSEGYTSRVDRQTLLLKMCRRLEDITHETEGVVVISNISIDCEQEIAILAKNGFNTCELQEVGDFEKTNTGRIWLNHEVHIDSYTTSQYKPIFVNTNKKGGFVKPLFLQIRI